MPKTTKKPFKKWAKKKSTKMSMYKRKNAFAKSGKKVVGQVGFAKGNFPPTLFTPFNFNQRYNLSNSGSYIQQFRLNSLADPDYTSFSTDRPRYFSTMLGADGGSAPYYNYRVHGFALKVFFTNTSSIPVVLSITVSRDSASPPNTLSEAYERTDTIVKTFAAISAGGSLGKMQFTGKIKNYLSHKDIRDIDGAAAAYSNSPSEVVLATIRIWAIDGASAYAGVLNVNLIQLSELYTLNDVADS